MDKGGTAWEASGVWHSINNLIQMPDFPSPEAIASRRAAFRSLHDSGCFVIPNPWDGGSAVRMAKAGFKALASTSGGAAMALGRSDGEMTCDEVLEHLKFLVSVTDLPVNADFEAGFADTPEGVYENVKRAIETGVAGISIEDAQNKKLLPMDVAVERLKAARRAIDASGQDVLLIGRVEAYLMPEIDMDEVIKRLKAYSAAGADVLYPPGLKTLEQYERVVRETDKPVNALLGPLGNPDLTTQEISKTGVRRISIGASFARKAYAAVEGYIERLKTEGKLPA